MPVYDIFSATAALVAVIAMILLSRNGWQFLVRMRSQPKIVGPLAVETSLALDARRRLILISCDGQKLLLLTGGPSDIMQRLPDSAARNLTP